MSEQAASVAAGGGLLFIYNGLSIIFYVGLFILINFNTGGKIYATN